MARPKGPMVTKPTDFPRPLRAKEPRTLAVVAANEPASLDCAAIMQSAGEAAYEWRIDTDALTWSPGAAKMLGLRDTAPVETGRGFANLLDPGNASSRFDAVT